MSFTLWALEHGAKPGDVLAITVDAQRKNLLSHFRGSSHVCPVAFELNGLKQRTDANFRALLAVHEAGHALEYVRHLGLGSRLGKVDVASESGENINTDVDPTNCEIEDLLQLQLRRADQLLGVAARPSPVSHAHLRHMGRFPGKNSPTGFNCRCTVRPAFWSPMHNCCGNSAMAGRAPIRARQHLLWPTPQESPRCQQRDALNEVGQPGRCRGILDKLGLASF